ncbi:MAG: hypothetical protein ACOYOO_05790 [Saprospiraceae bacterium]
MFNTANYFEKTRDIDWASMPEALSKGHTLVTGAADKDWEGYKSNDTVRRVVEAYFTKLKDYLATQKPAAAITTPQRHSRQQQRKQHRRKGPSLLPKPNQPNLR